MLKINFMFYNIVHQMITLKQITYSLAVQKTLHFKKAAELCFISPSNLSNAINEMELQLGFQVFERTNKQVMITASGKSFLKKAKEIKLHLDDISLIGSENRLPLSTPISIGIIPTISPYLLPIVLPTLKKKYPNLKLNIIEAQSKELITKVKNGDIDTAILALPYNLDGLLAFKFWQEDFYFVTHIDNNNFDFKNSEIKAKELEKSELMLLEDGHCLKEHALTACKISNEGQYTMKASSLNTLIQLVAGKMGSTLIPQMALKQLLKSNDFLKRAHLNEPGPHREIALIIRPNYAGAKNIELLCNLFKKELTKIEL